VPTYAVIVCMNFGGFGEFSEYYVHCLLTYILCLCVFRLFGHVIINMGVYELVFLSKK